MGQVAEWLPYFDGVMLGRQAYQEPYLLAWAGATRNTLFVHAVGNERFAATPDGVIIDEHGMRLAETKAKHNKVVNGPEPKEIRQMAWQLMCVPEAVGVNFVWGEYVKRDGLWVLRRDPQTIPFDRDHPAIVAATDLIVPIAHKVVEALDRAGVELIGDGAASMGGGRGVRLKAPP